MDQSSQVPYTNVLASQSSDLASVFVDDKDQNDRSSTSSPISEDSLSWMDDRSGRVHPTVDVAEIIRRWTHALQRIHKQSLHLVRFIYLFIIFLEGRVVNHGCAQVLPLMYFDSWMPLFLECI